MGMNHLVESHLGGIYISDSPAYIITATCDQCGDSDWIVASWDDGDRTSEAKALAEYFISEWNRDLDSPWEVLMYWYDEYVEDLDDEDDLMTFIDEFNGYSSDDVKNDVKDIARGLWKPYEKQLEEWGIKPFNRNTLEDALVSSAPTWFGKSMLSLDAVSMIERENENISMSRGRDKHRRQWENDFPGGEGVIVSAMERLFPGYKMLYEKQHDISL